MDDEKDMIYEDTEEKISDATESISAAEPAPPEVSAEETAAAATVEAVDSSETANKKIPLTGKLAAWLGLAITAVVCIGVGLMIWKMGLFESTAVIRGWVEKAGFFAPLVLIAAQAAQVIIRFVPGGVTCTAGVIMFGPVWGFVINYVGMLTGCVIVFFLVRKYGISIAEKLAGRENLEKYWKWTSGRRFDVVFIVTAILPAFPDDIICVAAALTKISFKKYFLVCALGRTFGLALYSLAAAGVFSFFKLPA